MPCPCCDPKMSVRSISRSSVPCSNSNRSLLPWVDISPKCAPVRVRCQPKTYGFVKFGSRETAGNRTGKPGTGTCEKIKISGKRRFQFRKNLNWKRYERASDTTWTFFYSGKRRAGCPIVADLVLQGWVLPFSSALFPKVLPAGHRTPRFFSAPALSLSALDSLLSFHSLPTTHNPLSSPPALFHTFPQP